MDPSDCYVGIGGNVGDMFSTMETALSRLDKRTGIRIGEVSPVYRTAPVGPAHDEFLNAAVRLECELTPRHLLRQLQEIEDQAGRIRTSRWMERKLDLDLLLFGDAVVAEPELTIPHPHLWYRRFVLDPLADIAADVVHPLFGESIRQLRQRLGERPLCVALEGGTAEERSHLARELSDAFPDVRVEEMATPPEQTGVENGREPAIVLLLAADDNAHLRRRAVALTGIPGSRIEAASSVLTAALDEPQRQRRPLRRMP